MNKMHKIPASKKRTYIDQIMTEKSKIPSPDKYLCNVHRPHFNDPTKKSKIYTSDRKSSMDDVIKESKKSPGVGKYTVTTYDEKHDKKPKGLFKVGSDRITVLDEVQTHARTIPSHYPAVELVSTHFKLTFFAEQVPPKTISTGQDAPGIREREGAEVESNQEER